MTSSSRLSKIFKRYQATFSDFAGIELKDINQKGLGGDCLIHVAAYHLELDDIQLLVNHGANVNASGDIGLTALHLASARGHEQIVAYLLSEGADRELANDFEEKPIDWAIASGNVEIIKILSR